MCSEKTLLSPAHSITNSQKKHVAAKDSPTKHIASRDYLIFSPIAGMSF